MWLNSLKNNTLVSWAIKLGILCLILIIVFLFGESLYDEWTYIKNWVESQGPWAPAIFILLITLLPVLSFPTDPLCFFGGALFGLAWGGVYTVIGLLLSASIMFFLAQRLLRNWLLQKVQDKPKLQHLDQLIQAGGFTALVLLRILPLPFALLSYFLGLTGVRFREYFWAVFGTMGTVLLSVYYGSVASHVADLSKGESPWKISDGLHILLWLSLFLILALLTRIAQKKLKALEEKSLAH